MNPYIAKPLLRATALEHKQDCAVKDQAPFCTCGELTRWLLAQPPTPQPNPPRD